MVTEKLQKMSVQSKATLVFTIATFICKGINFLTMPIFTRIMTTKEMGTVTTYNSWYLILVVFANLSLDSGSFNIAMMDYKEKRYSYMSSILALSTIASVVIGCILIIFKKYAISLLGIDEYLLWLMIVSFVFLPATSFWMLYQRYIYSYKKTAVVTILSTGMSVVVSAFITLQAKSSGVENLADIRIISANAILIVWGVLFYIIIFIKGRTGYHKEYWKFVLCVNTPLMIHSLAKHVLDVSDRTMIAKMVGISEVGIYGVLYSVSALALIVWSAINASLIPYMFEYLKQRRSNDVSKIVELMLFVYSIACIGLTFIGPELVKILATEEYYEAVYLMPPIAAGIFFISLYNVYSNMLLFYKKTNYIMIATIVAAAFNIVANYIFIGKYGYRAAAYTTLLSYIILAFMQFIQIRRIEGKASVLNNRRIWVISCITIIVCICINILYQDSVVRYTILLIIICLIILLRNKILEIINEMRDIQQ